MLSSSLPETYRVLFAQKGGADPKIETLPLPKPAKNQVLVKLEFAPINPLDIMCFEGDSHLGPDKLPHPVGVEGSGVIAAVGEDLKVPHQVGDKVQIFGLGAFAEYILLNSEACEKVRGDLPMEQAACHFGNPATVVTMGQVVQRGGHKAAIHTAGASALGRMLIRYLKHKGIKTINIVRRDELIEELLKDGADYVLNSQAPDFEQKLKEIAEKEEATIAFDAVCGDLTAKIIRNQPKNSVCYAYGSLASVETPGIDVREFIFNGKTLTGFTLFAELANIAQAGKMQEFKDEVYGLLPTILRSNIQKVFRLDEIKEALAFYKKNSSYGKILIKPN